MSLTEYRDDLRSNARHRLNILETWCGSGPRATQARQPSTLPMRGMQGDDIFCVIKGVEDVYPGWTGNDYVRNEMPASAAP